MYPGRVSSRQADGLSDQVVSDKDIVVTRSASLLVSKAKKMLLFMKSILNESHQWQYIICTAIPDLDAFEMSIGRAIIDKLRQYRLSNPSLQFGLTQFSAR
jgi:hypothetical protein